MSAITRTTRNGVDTEKLFATLDLLQAEPELARFEFRVTGNASPETLREVVARATERSAVYDIVAHGVPLAVDVTSG